MKTVTTFNTVTTINTNEDVRIVFAPGVEAILHKEVIAEIDLIKEEGSTFMVAGGYFRDQLLNQKVSDVDIFVSLNAHPMFDVTRVGDFVFGDIGNNYGDMVRANSARKGVFNLVLSYGNGNELKQKYNEFTLDISKFGVLIQVTLDGELVLVEVLNDGLKDLMSNTLTCGKPCVDESTLNYVSKVSLRSVFQGWNIHFRSGDVMFYNDESLDLYYPDQLTSFSEEIRYISEFFFEDVGYTASGTYGARVAYNKGKRGTDLLPYLQVFKKEESSVQYTPKVWTQEDITHGWDVAFTLSSEGRKLWGEKKYRLALTQHPWAEVQMLALGWKGRSPDSFVSWGSILPIGFDLVGAKPKACESAESPLEWYCLAFWSKYLGLAAKDISRYYKTHIVLLVCGPIPNSHATQVARSEQLLGALISLSLTPNWEAGKTAKQCVLAAIEKAYPGLDPEMLLETPSVAEAYQEIGKLGKAATYSFKIVGKKVTETGWSLEVLPKDSQMNLFIGNLTECCQHLQGAARDICVRGWSDPHSINYVIKSPSGKVMAHFWTWVDQNGRIVIDSIEGRSSAPLGEVCELVRQFASEWKKGQVLISQTNYGLTRDVCRELGLVSEVDVSCVKIQTKFHYSPDAFDSNNIWVYEPGLPPREAIKGYSATFCDDPEF